MSLVDPAVAGKVLPKSNKPSGAIKMKKSIAKNVKPKDGDSKVGTRTPSPDSPSVNGNDTESRASVPASQTGEDGMHMVRCRHCKKPVPRSSTASHNKICPEKKNKEKILKKKDPKEGSVKPMANNEDKESEAPGDDSPIVKANGDPGHGVEGISSAKGVAKSAKKSAVKDTTTPANDNSSKKTKKRKADMEGDKEPKKKKLKKDEPPKPKVPKPKGPVDVEKQCGVLLPNGGYCARSLTCKSHSMGAKRAVPGRSMPYDFLLAQYQKKNQAKQQSKSSIFPDPSSINCYFPTKNYTIHRIHHYLHPYISISWGIPSIYTRSHFDLLPSSVPANQPFFSKTEAAMDANAPLADDTDAHAPVDSDEEKDAVMAAIARSRPQPLAQHVPISLRRKHQRIRVKDALANALAGNRGGNLFAIRPPPEAASAGLSQMAMAAAAPGTGTGGGSVVRGGGGGTVTEAMTGSPVEIGTGRGGQQNDSGGGLERQPSLIQALGANASAAADGAGGGGGEGSQSRKSSVAGAATIT
ncbi:MAG: hypothetical protein Q9196_000010 [Gyalolechia fulgens]